MVDYAEFDTCPFKPKHTVEWLENYFKKDYRKKPYDRFMWWRSYVPKRKPLGPRLPLKSKVENGDYDYSPFRFEAELVEHRLREKWNEYYPDLAMFQEKCAVDLARRKRLMEDYEKDEFKRLEAIRKDFSIQYGIPKHKIDDLILQSPGDTVKDFYKYMEKKYGYKPAPIPKFS